MPDPKEVEKWQNDYCGVPDCPEHQGNQDQQPEQDRKKGW